MALSKTVFIERKSRSQAVAAFDKAASQMHNNRQSVYIFPEGTRVPHGARPPLQAGFAGLYKMLGLPVVPVAGARRPTAGARTRR